MMMLDFAPGKTLTNVDIAELDKFREFLQKKAEYENGGMQTRIATHAAALWAYGNVNAE